MTALDVTAAPEVFSDADRERLAQLERTIINGLDAYIAVGRALEKIRTRRLYLLTHRTFREYLADRFGLSHPRGFALCYSAQVADVLEAAGEHPAGAESALREFFPVLRRNGPEATVEAFRKVAPDGVLPLSFAHACERGDGPHPLRVLVHEDETPAQVVAMLRALVDAPRSGRKVRAARRAALQHEAMIEREES